MYDGETWNFEPLLQNNNRMACEIYYFKDDDDELMFNGGSVQG